MKKFIVVLGIVVSLIAIQLVFAQQHGEGSIVYEVKVNLHRSLPPDRAEMKEVMPQYHLHRDVLFFNGTESLYKSLEEEEDDAEEDGPGSRMRFRRPRMETYVDHPASRRITLQEFFGRKYLIEDTVKVLPWKLAGDTRTILGHVCRTASYYNEETKQKITVWYAEGMRPSLGPESFINLPGTVLSVDINDGERIITATEIRTQPLRKGDIRMPVSGERITRKEFRELVEEQRRRMADRGNIIIRK